MITAAQLVANVIVTGAKAAAAELGGVDSAAKMSSASLRDLALAGVAIAGVALVGIGTIAAKMAGDWQVSMTKLVTSGGESRSALAMVSAGLLDMAVQTGTATDQMAKGMYYVESAGFHGAAGLQVLKFAAMGAKAENADLGVVANAVTSALNAYGYGADKAAFVTNTLVAATANGKMTMQDLASAVSNVLPATAKFHISLIDTTAAIATMTMQGDDASSAATHLRQVILALESPAAAGAKAIKAIGLTTAEVSKEMTVSLPGAIQLIIDHLGKKFPEGSVEYNNAIKAIAGGNKQLLGLLELSGTSLQNFKNNVKNMTEQVKVGGNSIAGWDLIQGNFNFKMDQGKAAMEKLMITLGTKLLPVLGQIVGAITPIISGFTSWVAAGGHIKEFLESTDPKMVLLKLGIVALAGAIGGALIGALILSIPALVAFAVAAWAAVVPLLPFIAIGAAIALAIVGIVLAVQHWGAIMAWLSGVWRTTVSYLQAAWSVFTLTVMGALQALGNFFAGVWSAIVHAVQAAWAFIVSTVTSGAQATLAAVLSPITAIVGLFQWLYNHNYYFQALVDTIRRLFTQLFSWASGAWQGFTSWLSDRWNWAKSQATSIWAGISNTIQQHSQQASDTVHTTQMALGSWLLAQWQKYGPAVTLAWQQVTASIRNAYGAVTGAVNWVIQGAINIITGFVGAAWNLGASIIRGVAGGIASASGAVGNAIHNAIGAGLSGLGFHGIPGFASGTSFAPGGVALVGERGPEAVYLPRGASVIPNNQLSSGGSGGQGQQPIIINTPIYLDGRLLAGGLMPHIANQIRYSTGVIM